MVCRGAVQKHYDNVSKTYEVIDLLDQDDLDLRNKLRTLILKELVKCCESVIEWIDDESNVNSEIARLYIESLCLGYDIQVIIKARNFIYDLLGKPLNEVLRIKG